jgi:maleylpyruvate isomerase
MLKLYSYFRSSASYRVRIALNFKGLKHDLIPVHLLKEGGEQLKAGYIEKNPMGQLPLLEHGDFRLPQSMAILLYLDTVQPAPALFSQEPQTRAKQIAICELINSGIQPLQNLKVLKHLRDHHGFKDDSVDKWCRHWIEEGFRALEAELSKTAGTYAFGGAVSAVDCFVAPQVFSSQRYSVDMSRFPTIARVNENCQALDAFKWAHPSRQADAE